MRQWQLRAGRPLALRFAADARLGRVDYTDDQSWEVAFGDGDQPALAFVTRYGGRAGIVRVVPMFILGTKAYFEAKDFAELPTLVAFAPNYARLTARPRPDIGLTVELWVMDSHCVGGRFTITNDSGAEVTGRLDLVAQAVRDELPVRMNMLTLESAEEALHLGLLGNLNPVMLVEGSSPIHTNEDRARPKLTAMLRLPANSSTARRWVVCGEKMRQDSLVNGYQWLFDADWEGGLKRLEAAAAAEPTITMGDPDLDAGLAWSQQVLLRSFISATDSLPNPSIVTARIPARGFSPNGTGTDHGWQWNGQNVRAAYLALPAAAFVVPELAKAAFRNWVSIAAPDGWIDAKPGAAGQRANRLCPPLLAAIAWEIYENTGDRAFLEGVYPPLLRFFERWFAPDQDADRDGYPEWKDDAHAGYSPNPTFGRNMRWAQGADISLAETPDLGAALVHDGLALMEIADLLGRPGDLPALQTRLDALTAAVEAMWDEGVGGYLARDRDTHRSAPGSLLFAGKGDEAFDSRPVLDPPNRLLLRIVGGTNRPPNVTITVEGIDHAGNHTSETLTSAQVAWLYGAGAAISQHAYQRVNYVKFSGLSRVFTTEISTIDLTRHNLTLLTPLWAGIPDAARAERIRRTLADPARYARPHGWPICPADDPSYKPNNEEGSGGVWGFWQVLLIEGLLRYDFHADALAQIELLLTARIGALKQTRALYEAHDSETGDGLGDPDELAGILPLALLLASSGVRIWNARQVRVGGTSIHPGTVRVSAFGVEVAASADQVRITFPSGHTLDVPRPADWITVEDPTPIPEKAVTNALITVQPEPAVPAMPAIAIELPPAPITNLDDIIAAEEAPLRTVPLVMISDPDAPEVPATLPEAAVIPVVSKKDDTVEIIVSQPYPPAPLNELPSQPANQPSEASGEVGDGGTFKIPIKGD